MIDDNTCYRCPRMKYHEGPCETRRAPMNSDHAPTAEEQLPPLDVTKAEAEKATAATWLTHGEKSLFAKLLCRERQLLAALRENRELERKGMWDCDMPTVREAINRAEAAEAKLRDAERERDHTWTQRNADLFAERNALQAKLRAISDALDENKSYSGHTLFARIRAIVEA